MKKMIRILAGIVMVIVVLSIMKALRGPTVQKQSVIAPESVKDTHSKPVVPVEVLGLVPGKKQHWGTGFVVEPSGYLLTCAHVIKDAKEIEVSVQGSRYKAKVVAVDETNDLALLKVPAEGLPFLQLSDKAKAETGQTLAVIGFPFAVNYGVYVCEDYKPRMVTTELLGVRSAEARDIAFKAPLNPGFTGSPVVNVHGAVIALVNGVRSGPGMKAGIGLDIRAALPLLRDNGVRCVTGEVIAELDLKELYQRIRPATVHISILPKDPLPWPQAWAPNVPKLVKKFGVRSMICLAISPDGALIAAAVIKGFTNEILIIDVKTGETKHTFARLSSSVTDLEFSPNSDMLASTGYEGPTFLWSMPSGALWNKLPHAKGISFSPDGEAIACRLSEPPLYLSKGGESRPPAVKIYEVKSGSLKASISPSQSGLHGLIAWAGYLPNRNQFLTVGHYQNTQTKKQERFHLWDPDSGELIRALNPTQLPTRVATRDAGASVAISPDGRQIAVVEPSEYVYVYDYDLETLDLSCKVYCYKTGRRALCFSPDGRILTVGATESLVEHSNGIFDVSTGTLFWRLRGGAVLTCFSPDGTYMFHYVRNFNSLHMYDISGLTVH
jgi:hypothetical protein